MRTRARLKPGQKGTKKLVEIYGDTLVCVRYRYDAQRHKQYKTVEIIVSESDWTPPPANLSENTLVELKIGFKETDLRHQVKAVGGRWDVTKSVWIVPYKCIRNTDLEKHIHVETLNPP